MEGEVLIAIDPGYRKCGLVVIGKDCDLLERRVVRTLEVTKILCEMIEYYKPDNIILGSGTYAKKLLKELKPVLGGITLTMVNEHFSTEKGRKKYLADHPARGLMRLVPVGMRIPKEPYDDYAALVLAEKYLAKTHLSKGKRE